MLQSQSVRITPEYVSVLGNQELAILLENRISLLMTVVKLNLTDFNYIRELKEEVENIQLELSARNSSSMGSS